MMNNIIEIPCDLIEKLTNIQINQLIRGKILLAGLFGLVSCGGLPIKSFPSSSAFANKKSKIDETTISLLQLNEDELFIAKILYSETSTLCSYEDIIAIACIIQNRINLKDFGNCKSAIEVCKYPGTFSSAAKHNSNWDQYDINLNKFTTYDAKVSKLLACPKFKIIGKDWMKDIVYYHDKSISKPRSWDNKYYKAILVKETAKFKFYKVEKVENF